MTVLSRKAVLVQGALMVHLAPKLAQDVKLNLTPILAGVSALNFTTSKAKIAADIKTATTGKLAKDASLNDLTELLDALEDVGPTEGADADPNTGLPMAANELREHMQGEDAEAETEEEREARMAKRKAAGMDRKAMDAEETPEEKKERMEARDAKRRAHDADPARQPAVDKKAMDAAIAAGVKNGIEAAVTAATKAQKDIRDAERAVRPWVGELTMAHDSAEAVYRTALGMLNVKVDGVHASALPVILEHTPKPGAQRQERREQLGMDAASVKGFADRYPDAVRIGNA